MQAGFGVERWRGRSETGAARQMLVWTSALIAALCSSCTRISPGTSYQTYAALPTGAVLGLAESAEAVLADTDRFAPPVDREAYDRIVDNPFIRVADQPLSTFSIDVDTASYANIRRFLLGDSVLPPPDAVRIEELVNYFPYAYAPPGPEEGAPFATHVEIAGAPWAPEHRLVRIGIKGRELGAAPAGQNNFVFLIDVSGSMNEPRKLPLLKSAFRLLVEELADSDRVAIVVYAGASGLALESTPGSQRQAILAALDDLEAGGSTAGAAGIELAYKVAQENFITGGNNRVILATDGDFNVGISDTGSLVRLIERKAKSGVFLSVLGFGAGNLNDAMMEKLTNAGDGNYSYIDSIREARKVFLEEMGGTLVAIAKDVKVQVEFNPGRVSAYRLIGYENRLLAAEDFNDDTKDAGEIGAGHTVTALYEVVPAGVELPDAARRPPVDALKYQQVTATAVPSEELLSVKLRYKAPEAAKEQGTSHLLEVPAADGGAAFDQASADLKFAAAVASFGMLLRDSPYRGTSTYASVLDLARSGITADNDRHGYRAEFLKLVEAAADLDRAAPRLDGGR